MIRLHGDMLAIRSGFQNVLIVDLSVKMWDSPFVHILGQNSSFKFV